MTGKVVLSDGSPFKGGSITLQPMETGHPVTFKLDKEGSLKGEIIPGKFMYFVPENVDPASIKTLDKKFLTPDVARFTVVSASEPIRIELK